MEQEEFAGSSGLQIHEGLRDLSEFYSRHFRIVHLYPRHSEQGLRFTLAATFIVNEHSIERQTYSAKLSSELSFL